MLGEAAEGRARSRRRRRARWRPRSERLHLFGAVAAQRGDVEQAKTLMEGLFAEKPDIIGLGHDLPTYILP